MLSFECDYNKGAHKKILERLLETNEEPAKGYGINYDLISLCTSGQKLHLTTGKFTSVRIWNTVFKSGAGSPVFCMQNV